MLIHCESEASNEVRSQAAVQPYIYGDAFKAGIEAYSHGMPLVLTDRTVKILIQAGSAGQYNAPLEQLGRMQTQVSPDFKNIVRIGLDGLRSLSSVDLDEGPVAPTVPGLKRTLLHSEPGIKIFPD